MTLYYIDDTGVLENATLAAYIQIETPREEAWKVFSRFDKEWWKNISKEAKIHLTVDMEAIAPKEL